MQHKYFRDLLRSDPGVTADAVERLSDICSKEIAQIRVRLPLAVRRPGKSPPVVLAATKPAAVPATFDPHAFSLIVVFRTGGKDALMAKLDAVPDVEQLRAIAKAQHVALDGDPSDRAAVLSALVSGTERRIAHREAAAS